MIALTAGSVLNSPLATIKGKGGGKMRLILSYEKLGPMAFVSHLDFQQLWWRMFRLAHIDLEMTQGYNPRPKMRFALPLATSFQGERELLEVYLAKKTSKIVERINLIAPQGFRVHAATCVPQTFPKITALVDALGYQVELPRSLNNSDCLYRQAGGNLLFSSQEEKTLRLLIKVENQRTVRPDTLVAACFEGSIPASFSITRTGIYTAKRELEPLPQGLKMLPQDIAN